MSHDAHHVTSIEPSKAQVRRCYTDALANAGKQPEEIAYLNAHGPGTKQCDATEGEMLDTLLTGADVFSVKPLAGHCQGAAAGKPQRVLGEAVRDGRVEDEGWRVRKDGTRFWARDRKSVV